EIESFQAIGGSEGESLFAAGLVEELLTILAMLSNSLSVRAAEPGGNRHPEAGARDSARLYRLSGSVRRSEEDVRVAPRLTSVGNRETIWASKFDYKAGQSFDAQELIAREVVTAVQVTLTEGDQAQFWRRATTSVRAWELFQRGHDLEQRLTRHGHIEARRW